MRLDEPIDEIHRWSLEAIALIREQTNEARRRLGLPPRDYK